MPLRFCRKRLSYRASIGVGLGMAQIDRPVEKERSLFEHRAIDPSIARVPPEHRMRHSVSCLPIPGLVAPESSRFIAACSHELQILPVRHHVLVDFKRGKLRGVRLELIVPPKTTGGKAQRRRAGRNLNHSMINGRSDETQRIRLSNLPV